MFKTGCPYGTHRVLEPKGALPQGAWKIDNTMEIYDNEILVDVDVLNIDAASFTQIRRAAGDDREKIAAVMLDIVAKRGKHHNPVTGSGGMFIGRVAQIGPALQDETDLKVGDKIASLVSLSLTPLHIERIKKIHLEKDQVVIEGQAVLFASGLYAVLPPDLPERLALAVLDVAGAPAQTARLVHPGDTVLVVGGGGKSGLLCLYEAKKRAGVTGRVIGIGSGANSCTRMRETGLAGTVLQVSATDPLAVLKAVEEATGGRLADLTINCVNVPGTEMASILATKEGGTIYFFSMATSFTAAALGAEGVGKDVRMLIGNGYAKGHAQIALQVLRESKVLRELFERLYA
ncbi:L-erythro-3,5-diaminohexanoate dehydrogenase [Desulfotomaculum copahuensis]|uniref:L-erythro-3,5-diaminohexanoate dehydrogenase n=1 Tax=Desulfotomaculum copahuensis TaxID=1838280 RepID=A0A1B7LCQ7_9FIRM|nr:L-erythro-3,5-diaminohexanoate dehydrogenase [Desulfotomaculum copahuensis]OAT80668.1 L-erythro-3,5-diaminohexanoate dehydrogenase [Desulfotomaculum copahuensis]